MAFWKNKKDVYFNWKIAPITRLKSKYKYKVLLNGTPVFYGKTRSACVSARSKMIKEINRDIRLKSPFSKIRIDKSLR